MRSNGVCSTTWRWSRWPRPPKPWWRPWATLRPPSSAPPTWSTSGPCSRLALVTRFAPTRVGWRQMQRHVQVWGGCCACVAAGVDPPAGSVQRRTPGLRRPRGGLPVSGGDPLRHQDRVHLQHAGLLIFTDGLSWPRAAAWRRRVAGGECSWKQPYSL